MRKNDTKSIDICGLFLSGYLGTAPVYWFWSLPIEWINLAKIVLFVFITFLIWIRAALKNKFRLPPGLPGVMGIILLFITLAPIVLKSELDSSFRRYLDVTFGYVMLWNVYFFVKMGGDIRRVLQIASIVLLPFCGITLIHTLFGFPNWDNPYIISGDASLSKGFGGERTGWSNGIALFLPCALLIAGFFERQFSYRSIFNCVAVMVLIVGSQLVSGGRAGLIASTVALIIMTISGRSRRSWLFILLLILIPLVLFLQTPDWMMSHLRLDRIENINSFLDLDSFSGSRINQIYVSLNLILENPLLGHGIISQELMGLSNEIHNIWLRLAVQAGILAPLVFAVIVCVFVRNAIQIICQQDGPIEIRNRDYGIGQTFLAILSAGLVISLFEPNAILGSFQNSSMWWVAAGAAASRKKSLRVN